MRHTPAKSPLSRPYESPLQNGDPPINGFSLGPPRAASPSANRGAGSFASLGATVKSLHPLSATPAGPPATVPAAASAVGNVAGGAFASGFSDGPASSPIVTVSTTEAVPASAKPQISVAGTDDASTASEAPKSATDEKDDAKKVPTAAEKAMNILEHGLPASPQSPEKSPRKTDGSSASDVKVVVLPPTHIQSPSQ